MVVLLAWLVGCGGGSAPLLPAHTVTDAARSGIASGRTNVVFVVIDTLRADHLGLYGFGAATSPWLDQLGADSVVFDRFFATCSWTRPSMASMFSGLYPRTTGIYEEQFDRLPDDISILGQRFAQHGYVTIGVTANPNLNRVFGFAKGFEFYSDSGAVWKWMKRLPGQDYYTSAKNNSDPASSVTDRALAAIDELGDDPRPFYLRAVYIDPHMPYKAPLKYQARVTAGGSRHPGYDGDILNVDTELARLMAGLASRGRLQDTLIIVTSDHGEGLDSHPSVADSDTHGTTLYDSVLRVPLIISHPSLQARRVDALTSMIDLVPTVYDLMGWQLPALPGHSLAPLLRGEAAPALPGLVFAETDWRKNRKLAVRSEDRVLIRNDDCRLYQEQGAHEGRKLAERERKHLAGVPPLELYPLSGREEPAVSLLKAEPERAAKLQAALLGWEKSTPKRMPVGHSKGDVLTLGNGKVIPAPEFRGTVQDGQLDAATRAQLEAIGYLGEGD